MPRPLTIPLLAASLACSVLAAAESPRPLSPTEEIETFSPKARHVLDTWHADAPAPADQTLHLVLWTPADRDPAPRYRERLCAVMHHIQAFYASEMERLGLGPRTFALDTAEDGLTRVHLVRGVRPYANYEVNSGRTIRNECLPTLREAGIDPDQATIILFCNMSVWDPQNRTISQNSPYYASGSHRSGTAWQVDSPILDVDLLAMRGAMVHDGQYGHISVGRYNSIFIGGVAHELGHALGLPHCRERPDERELWGTALMGSGNRSYGEELRDEGKGSFLTLAHGLRLASHPLFSRSSKDIDTPASSTLEDLTFTADDRGFVVSGRVQSDPPPYAVVAYLDPSGGSDYDATTASAVPDADGRFTLFCHALAPGKAAELRLFVLQVNGAAGGNMSSTPHRYTYQVDATGRPDLTSIYATLAFQPLSHLLSQDPPALDAAHALVEQGFDGDEDGRLREIATRLLNSFQPAGQPDAKTLAEAGSWPLSDLPPTSQAVGWGRPVRDRLPGTNTPLASGNRLFAHGLYAHAPARHEWDLDGSWSHLRGLAGLANNHHGTSRFTIEGDGEILWSSDRLDAAAGPLAYDIPLIGIKRLALITDDAEDGNSGDWSLWLEPTLIRTAPGP
jgi:hypothetical protein